MYLVEFFLLDLLIALANSIYFAFEGYLEDDLIDFNSLIQQLLVLQFLVAIVLFMGRHHNCSCGLGLLNMFALG